MFAEIQPGFVLVVEMGAIAATPSLERAQALIDQVFDDLSRAFPGDLIGGMHDAENHRTYWAFRSVSAAQAAQAAFNGAYAHFRAGTRP